MSIAENNTEIYIFNFKVPFVKLSDNMPSVQSDLPGLILLIALCTMSCVTLLGYEPADLTVHPPPQNDRGWVHFFRIGV